MAEDGGIQQFQRWLQAKLSMTEQIDDTAERIRSIKQIESAIQLAIQYRLIVTEDVEDIPSPFVDIDSPVRLVNNESITSTTVSNQTICTNCDAAVSEDLDFCPACGEYR